MSGSRDDAPPGAILSEPAGEELPGVDAQAIEDPPGEADQPGLRQLRAVVANHLRRRLPGRSTRREDGAAALTLAIANVPDGMANGFIVGVSPIHGLYAAIVGPLVGGLLASTQLMVITTTAAASLTAGQAIVGIDPERRPQALFAMVILVGLFQIAIGLLGLGRLARFVSYSVTVGLLTGISLLLVLSQLPTVTGYAAEGGNRVLQAWDVFTHAREVDPPSLGAAAIAIGLAVVLARTRWSAVARLAAVIVPSAVVALFGLDSVRVVSDLGEIPRGVPALGLPALTDFTPAVITGAFSVAVVILVQGVGVSQSVPNPDGTRTRVRRDILAQGVANAVSGLMRGLPVGGSLSASALAVVSGARSRWAAIGAGLAMGVIVLGTPGVVSLVAMPALGALLILAGLSSLDGGELYAVWRNGWPSRLAAATTFCGTLFLPIQAAVALGVVLAALLYMNESAADVSVVELAEGEGGFIQERSAPAQLPSDRVTVLDVYGNLFYAGARTLEQLLPNPNGSHHAVVVLRLRGRSSLGATLIDVLARYVDDLRRADGHLYLTGLGPEVRAQLVRTHKIRLTGPIRLYDATPMRGFSTRRAIEDARSWLVEVAAAHASDEATR